MDSGRTMTDRKIRDEWNEASISWADFVRKGKDHYRDEMNGPATLRMVGDVRGKRVLDLSCGEGYNARILAERGAKVVGVDFSQEMIRLAKQKEKTDKLGIRYCVSDAADLKELESGLFDVVTCFMALMDIERYEDAISQVARVLKKNGRLVFSITHPCFEWGETANGETLAKWKYDEGTQHTPDEKVSHLEIRKYFGAVRCDVSWTMKRLVKPFKTTSFHRTLSDYFNALHNGGFVVARLDEPKPTSRGISEHSCLRKHILIPHALVIEAIKS